MRRGALRQRDVWRFFSPVAALVRMAGGSISRRGGGA
jgi:hypothetical protein